MIDAIFRVDTHATTKTRHHQKDENTPQLALTTSPHPQGEGNLSGWEKGTLIALVCTM